MSDKAGEDSSNNQKNIDDVFWDSSVVIKAYDSSLKMGKEEIAKLISEGTNSKNFSTNKVTAHCSKNEAMAEASLDNIDIKVGTYVRATFVDGVDYEAKIVELNDGIAILKYIGYGNKQEVPVNKLIRSWGKGERRTQYNQAKGAAECKPGDNANIKSNKKGKIQSNNVPPQLSVPPIPPFPPIFNLNNDQEEHLAAMLMSWYMSGYYTGLYQGVQNSKSNIQPPPNKKS